MNRRVNRPKPKRRFSRFGPVAAVVVALCGCAGLVGFLIQQAQTAGSRRVSPIQGETLDPTPSIHVRSGTQYGKTVLMESREPLWLEADYRVPRRSHLETRVSWRCDAGSLEHQEGVARNRFFPPTGAAVATVEVTVGLYPRTRDKTLTVAVVKKTAEVKLISPVSGELLRNGLLDGFRIGDYPDPRDPVLREKFDLSNSYALIHPEKFLRPDAFYRVDDRSRFLKISPHLRLGDYALHYPWFSLGKRQYVALDPGLVRKTEELIDDLNRAGLPGDAFKIIYGFRPPAYNLQRAEKDASKSLKAPFSLHQYGKAVDFILDKDGDDQLDDLDGDGKGTVRDAAVLMHYVNILDRRYRDNDIPLYGGAGLYDHHDFWERPVQSPYVHMDVRGFLDPNGNLIRWPKTWPDTDETIRWGDL